MALSYAATPLISDTRGIYSSVNKLIKLAKYREERFVEGSRPSVSTLRRWIENGKLPGKKIGGQTYVEISEEMLEPTNNELANKIIKKVAVGE